MTVQGIGPRAAIARVRIATLVVLSVAAALLGLGCGQAQQEAVGTSQQALTGALPGSSFESGDGNLVVDATGAKDWASVSGLTGFFSKADKTPKSADNAFGQGTKEDNADVTVVDGSIPPNKSDLTEFYGYHEVLPVTSGTTTTDHVFVYLAWERSNVLGSANMDFEFNQLVQTDAALLDNPPGTTGHTTIARKCGDVLVTFDFTQGGGTPVLGLLRWLDTGTTCPASFGAVDVTQCFSSNALPCWGRRTDLSAAGFANGAVNTATVTDPILNVSLPALTFGEAGLDLTDAGVFPAGQCLNFSSVFLKSRSSASFTSEVKDFVAPVPANINNCGTIDILKVDDSNVDPTKAAPLSGAVFGLFTGTPSGTTCTGSAVTLGTPPVAVTCTTGTNGHCQMSDIAPATYCVAETTGVANHDLAPAQAVTVVGTATVSLTFVDPRQFGAVLITKVGKDKRCTAAGFAGATADASCKAAGVRLLSGAAFSVTDSSGNSVGSITTGADGTGCLDKNNATSPTGLLLGPTTLTVAETTAPSGYAKDATSQNVTLTAKADCSTTGKASAATPASAFTDTPRSTLSVSFASEVAPGATTATVQCTGDTTPSDLVEGTPDTLVHLVPGTYVCTVVIDP